ncbi:unnamed protein product [Phytophthora fragariaefolia]|uniref:Unnamed protein product n=1 Tax=Phytophthora fragariaefolia TaxID=1490495 RepID=A0A9W7D0P2_9STRA|nr:unnamed protein product [Phytophthora fragariaefolia]
MYECAIVHVVVCTRMTAELEEMLALLGDTTESVTEVAQRPSASSDNAWEPFLQWGISDDVWTGITDDDIGDFGNADIATAQTQAQSSKRSKKRKKANPNKARDERRFELIELHDEVSGQARVPVQATAQHQELETEWGQPGQ